MQELGSHEAVNADFEAVYAFMPRILDVMASLTISDRQRVQDVLNHLGEVASIEKLNEKLWKTIEGAERHKQRLRRMLDQISNETRRLAAIRLSATEKLAEIESIAQKYEDWLRWKNRYRALTDFLRNMVGISRGLKDLAEAESKLAKVASPQADRTSPEGD
jgi:DNA repair ATPase RecN